MDINQNVSKIVYLHVYVYILNTALMQPMQYKNKYMYTIGHLYFVLITEYVTLPPKWSELLMDLPKFIVINHFHSSGY